MISVASTQLCHNSREAAIYTVSVNGSTWVPMKLYLQKQLNNLWDLVCPPLVQMQSNKISTVRPVERWKDKGGKECDT